MVKGARVSVMNVDEHVFREFKQLVIAKHGVLRGFLGRELTEAMKLWIEREKNRDKEAETGEQRA
jgi:hypothetical protein